MYFKESDHIAAELPDLKEIVKVVDEQLFKTRGKLLIQPALWQAQFRLNINELSSVLDSLVEQSLLRHKGMLRCERCSVLNDPDEDEPNCTSCGESLEKSSEAKIFLFEPSYDPEQEYPDDEAEVWDWDNLSGYQENEINISIRKGYPDRVSLERFLRLKLDVELNEFDDPGGGQANTIYQVVKYFRIKGRSKELVLAAAKEHPNNPFLEALANKD